MSNQNEGHIADKELRVEDTEQIVDQLEKYETGYLPKEQFLTLEGLNQKTGESEQGKSTMATSKDKILA